MKRRQFIRFLAWPIAGWPQDLCVQHSGWVHLIVTLSGMAYMLLSSHSSLSQELVSQAKEASSEQQVFNNACRTCHTIKEGEFARNLRAQPRFSSHDKACVPTFLCFHGLDRDGACASAAYSGDPTGSSGPIRDGQQLRADKTGAAARNDCARGHNGRRAA
jgi:hypothetical protein